MFHQPQTTTGTISMASASLSPRLASSSSSPKQKCCSFSISLISNPRPTNLQLSKCIPQLGIYKFSTWNGLRQLNLPTSRFIVKLERKRRCKGVYASLFGVGAPEALVIGVVALLVFGPKGLAEVARNLGKTLRDFQPTIRELQEVSRDFKSTLEREIGLDDIQETAKPATSTRPTANAEDFDLGKPNTPSKLPSLPEASLGREDVKISGEQVEAPTSGLQGKLPPLPIVSLDREDVNISEEPVEAEIAELQVTDGSVLSKESETQEYLKQLEEQVQALLAEKQRKYAPAAAEVKSQDNSFPTETSLTEDNVKSKEQELEELSVQEHEDTSFSTEASFQEDNVKTKEQELEELAAQKKEDTSFSTEASSTEDNVKTKEHELDELAAQKHEEVPAPTESQVEPQGTEVTWTTKEAETQEYLKKLEEEVQELFAEKQKQTLTAVAEVNPEDIQEAASVSYPSQNSEKQA